MIERGPQGKLHVPSYKDGCYYGRVEDSCWLCVIRVATGATTSPLRYRIRDAQSVPDHDLIGEKVTVPRVDDHSNSLEQVAGTVVAVHTLSGDGLYVLTVETERIDSIHIEIREPAQIHNSG